MKNLIRFIQVYHFILLFLIVESSCLILYFSHNKYQESKILNFTQEYTSSIYNHYENINQYLSLKKENHYLKKENAKLYSIISQSKGSNDRVSDPGNFNYISARIIDNSIKRNINIITLDQGRIDGVKIGMGIRVEDGVIGIIKGVSTNYSKAISILNTNSSVSIKHESSNQAGKLIWRGRSHMTAQIQDIPTHTDINIGDTIKTNGFSKIFPANINMGVITSFKDDVGDGFYRINMRFINDINKSKNVYIIKSLDKEEIDGIQL